MSTTPRARRLRIAAPGALLAAMLGFSLTVSGPASADLGDQKAKVGKQLSATKDQIASAQDDLDDTSAALKAAYAQLTSTRAQLPAAQNAVALARANADLARQRNEQALADLAVAKQEEASASADLADATASLARTRSQVAGFAAQMYQEQGFGSMTIQFSATDAQDLADRMAMADNVADIQAQAIRTLSSSAADLSAKQARVSATRALVADKQAATAQAWSNAQAAQVQAEQAQAQLAALEASQSAAATSLDKEVTKERRRLEDLTAQSDALKARLREIAKKQAAAAAAHNPTTNPPPPNTPHNTGGFLSWPSTYAVTSPFGMRWHPILHYWRLHTGQDFANPCGSPVTAAADGVVVSAGWAGGYGNQVVIDHGIQRGVSLATTYNHLTSFVVTSGRVARGQIIAYAGTTGLSTGCHLHFETRENGVPVNPLLWL
ncbi:MAG: peptidoglycan DD-metalloendopeptidase family protein [Tetrasphaera sp.]|nr:peptidoglycan DD-metalloendopeptidase family protein [Tetrasphaera sp.]